MPYYISDAVVCFRRIPLKEKKRGEQVHNKENDEVDTFLLLLFSL
jgi:hypothetical protein